MVVLKHLQRLIAKAFRQDLCHAENFDDGAIQFHLVDIDITFIIIKITTMIKIRMMRMIITQAKWIGDLSDFPLRSSDVLPLIERGRQYHTGSSSSSSFSKNKLHLWWWWRWHSYHPLFAFANAIIIIIHCLGHHHHHYHHHHHHHHNHPHHHQRWANSVYGIEYKYEYYSVSEIWPNTNMNTIRSATFFWIRIRILRLL